MKKREKALLATTATAALATLALVPAAPATAASYTVEVQLQTISTVKESAGVTFTCPANQVMTGRSHSGDENGYTKYSCSRILINGEQVTVESRSWSSNQKESSSNYETTDNRVITGRWHSGNENGYTNYESGALWWQGRQLRLVPGPWTSNLRESSHSVSASPYHVMIGRKHSGDENGYTNYRFASVTVDG
ncbi:hypothetical protein [Streptosporangium sandarakinum]|uniref:Secreted protein n=1 Tax=Streptosporangium sandarakinum TaxID=1260955 RepID=A0A852VE10_9ACTN|nr:hypothetical protein [Streptosporangium sandarakinum]NYF44405.1 hypothetical protein [Streptosporangium sandarakinum]